MQTIILAAGKIDYTRLPFGMHQSNATIPVNGKPVISWILDDLIKKEVNKVTIVVRIENNRLIQLLEKHYTKRVNLQLVKVDEPKSILDSLQAGLQSIETTNEPIQIILGDTLIYDSYDGKEDKLYISTVTHSENWCVALADEKGELISLNDKKRMEGDAHLALCGYYCFSDVALLKNSLKESIENQAKEISTIILKYHSVKKMNLIHAENWFDFGNLESLINSKKSLLRPRHFNQLIIDPLLNTITKISEKNEKLEDELNWYSLLPEELKILTPRIISRNKNATQVTITQEFYGYPTLSELFVYGDLSISVWESIIQYLFEIHKLFSIYTKAVSIESSKEMYIDKTQDRINQLLKDDTWKEIWNYETININGKAFPNIPTLLKKLDTSIVNLTNKETYTIIHGDYCLSNLLYDLNNQIVRMIDPRGSFGQKGIYGDPRYDIAKLRHSIAGLYDYIVADLFTVSFEGNNFSYEILEDEKNTELEKYMDACISKYGYEINEIKLIEALLFLSMIPYHADYPARQQIMYIAAHQKLFNLYEM